MRKLVKTILGTAICVATILTSAGSAMALVGTQWSATNVPSTGLTNITFPMGIIEADHISGFYFAQQFSFVGTSDVGYVGLEPRPDQNGWPVLHAVFSSFIKGSTTTDPNCTPGADGGPGVSCGVDFNAPYSRTFQLEVTRTSGTTWVSTVVDTITGARVHIGSWTLPTGTGGIKNTQAGFIEWYPWNNGEPPNHCARLPYAQVFFGTPTTTQPGSVGTQGLAYEYGDCVGQVAFHTVRVNGGVVASLGFRGQTG